MAESQPPNQSALPMWLVNHPENLPFVCEACQTEMFQVVTSHWRIEQSLRRKSIHVIELESLITPQIGEYADAFICQLIRTWFVHDGQDFSLVDGISLGLIHEYELRHSHIQSTESLTAIDGINPFLHAVCLFIKLFEKRHPAVIYHDLQPSAMLQALKIVAGQRGIELRQLSEKTGTPHLPTMRTAKTRPSLRDWLYKYVRPTAARYRAWMLWAGYRLFHAHQPVVGMVFYHCLLPAKQRLQQQFYFLNISPGWLWHRPDRAGRQTAKTQHQAILMRWQTIRDQPSYRQRFEFMGVDCSQYFLSLFDQTVTASFMRTLNQRQVIQALFKRFEVRLLLVHSDEPNVLRLCILVARQLGIDSIVVQHGLYDLADNGSRDLLTANHACVGSESDAAFVRRHCPDHPVHVTGLIQLDQHVGVSTTDVSRPSAKQYPLRILVLTATTDHIHVASRCNESELYLACVVEAASALAEKVTVTFKLHPSENLDRYKQDMSYLAPRFNYQFLTGLKLPEALQQHDLMISTVSTGVAEALCLGKPVIFLNTLQTPVPVLFHAGSGLPAAENAKQLADMLQLAVEDYPTYLSQYDFQTPLAHIAPFDGHAADRLAEVVKQTIIQDSLRKQSIV